MNIVTCIAETKPVDKRLRGYSFNDRNCYSLSIVITNWYKWLM